MNLLILPTQLYNIIINKDYNIYIIEEPRYFTDFKFHKLKLAYHRASMKKYYNKLIKKNYKVKYIDFSDVNDKFYKNLKEIYIYDPYDTILLKKITDLIIVNVLDNQQFLISKQEVLNLKATKYQHDTFYKFMRKKYNILLTEDKKPIGGKWSYDTENRCKLPSNNSILIPDIKTHKNNKYIKEAIIYVNIHFSTNYGELTNFIYPIDNKKSIKWLNTFLETKLINFGKYEDAVSSSHVFIFHSVLSPMMNIGLLRDIEVLEITNKYYLLNKEIIPISSYEGFIRQLIGWRQYIYTIYTLEGENMRESNILKHYRKVNDNWWNDVGITPINSIIAKIKLFAYAHHIERLMFLSNWLLLNQTDPNDVYRIFMEWTIDAYDWVMVPNIYGMGQSASNIMTTRIYFSSSNYILKMSNFKKDNTEWTNIWDAVYYTFIKKHKVILESNYATAMQVKHYNNKSDDDKQKLDIIANKYFKFIK